MGVNLRDLVVRKPVAIDDLSGKVLVVDGHNMLYQFLSTIRNRDGMLFTNHSGEVTSHLIGLFSRVAKFMQKGLRLVFVFDGKVPELKHQELARRRELKEQAQKQYEQALESEDVVGMRKFAARTSRLTKDMVGSAKELIALLGLPYVQAPSEGEAQAAYMVKKGDGFAVVSQDFDSLLYGAPFCVQNLSLEGRRKLPGKFTYASIEPKLVVLDETLGALDISLEKLRWLAVLVGTDYNPRGVARIGPKKGLALVKKHESAESLFGEVELADNVSWRDVLDAFETMPVTDDYSLSCAPINRKALVDFLVGKQGFSEERVENTLDQIAPPKNQTSLGEW